MWAATRPQEITVAIQAASKSPALTTINRAATKSQAVKIMGAVILPQLIQAAGTTWWLISQLFSTEAVKTVFRRSLPTSRR